MAFASSGGQAFLAAAQRAGQVPKARLAVILHLSGMWLHGPRAYHRRIARAIFHDTAQAHCGEMFELESGDIALLCQAQPGVTPSLQPSALPLAMNRLFQTDLSPGQRLTTLWTLERDSPTLLSYATAQVRPC